MVNTGFLKGKKLLITGVLSNRSIAYGIAQACYQQGAQLAFSFVGERTYTRVAKLAEDFQSDLLFDCDVSSDQQINDLFAQIHQKWQSFDGFVHSIGFSPKEGISGDFLTGLSREVFTTAHEISSYSFPAMVKASVPYLNDNACVLTLTYLGAHRITPSYNTMGLAKASLESSVRYCAGSLGAFGRGWRANAISAGPIKTVAAASMQDFGDILAVVGKHSPIQRNVTIQDVGHTAAFLMSDLAAGISAQIVYVDGGFSTLSVYK
ncbi:MAG: SDR family oxidoreductase [Gammaproteobacteria bacterium]|nr:SDR family oxidoreductase [Gammaproteobacteria bacterium]